MIRNVKVKKMLEHTLFPVFSVLNRLIPKKDDRILIYCANKGLTDNSRAVFDYLVEHGYNEKYRIAVSMGEAPGECGRCGKKCKGSKERNPRASRTRATDCLHAEECNGSVLPASCNSSRPPGGHDGECRGQGNKIKNVRWGSRLRGIFWYLGSGHVFYSFGKLPIKPAKGQTVVNMWHGVGLKTIGLLSNINNGREFYFTHVFATSELFRPLIAAAFGCPEKNVYICGEPKTDVMYRSAAPCALGAFQKIVLWTPTFRQSKYLGYNDAPDTSLLPLFESGTWGDLNERLRRVNVRLIVKLHPMQDLEEYTGEQYSHLSVYSDEDFQEAGFELYRLLPQTDALIADYSSVYLEYLLLDKPIGFAVNDMEEYGGTRGFFFERPEDYMPGPRLLTGEDLYQFIEDVAAGRDACREERGRINRLVNYWQDGRNCERALEISGIRREGSK